jgi:DNA repair protein RecO (recombination protein O)
MKFMANYVTDAGICLRVTDFSETSQIVGMFTRTHGLVPLIAKGAKRASKKNVMSGPLDLLTSGEVVFVPAKEGGAGAVTQLGTLAAWELWDHRRGLRGDLAGLNAAMMCAEVTTLLVHPLDPHPQLFDELEAALKLLGECGGGGGGGVGRVLVAYLKAALMAAGYWPQLGKCLACGRGAGGIAGAGEERVRFSARAGGMFCAGCHVESAGGGTMEVPARVAVALELLDAPTGLKARVPGRAAEEGALRVALGMLVAQVEEVTGRGLRTENVVAGIFR